MRILVAEDEPVLLEMTQLILKRDGYDVIPTTNGLEAIEKIGELHPDLIITDIMMPVATGLEILAFLKRKNVKIPVIVLSSTGPGPLVQEAVELGADACAFKPFSMRELSEKVKKFL